MYHADSIHRVISRYGTLVMVQLVIETKGQYVGAVHGLVGDELVGSIPHENGDAFRQIVHQLNLAGTPSTCRAQIDAVDGWVTIDAKTERRTEGDPFLPNLGVGVVVELDPGEGDRLDASLNSRAKEKYKREVGTLSRSGSRWRLVLDGTPVGTLPLSPYPILDEATAAGFPLTCAVRLRRRQKYPFSVTVDAPLEASR